MCHPKWRSCCPETGRVMRKAAAALWHVHASLPGKVKVMQADTALPRCAALGRAPAEIRFVNRKSACCYER